MTAYTPADNSETKIQNYALRNPHWNFWQALYLILLVYLAEFFLGWLKIPSYLGNLQGFVNYLIIGFGEALLFFLALIIFFKLLRRPLSDLGIINFGLRNLSLGLIGGVALFFIVGILGNFLVNYLGIPKPQSFALAVEGADSFWQFGLLLLLGGIIVPFKEELVFRGLIYPTLRKGYGRGGGILLTALFFGLMHFDFIRFLPLFIGGIVLTWLYEKTQSLWSSIIAHGVWNILMTILMWLQKG
ncbi:MAG TPA: CPBP family intramembrane metalloprotease [Peptococcaceae bacterium]|nr:CPBP family intramembrane metalloprotease [Peptococcaceae bacterium]